jgi:uncharacterized protein YukJ
LRDTNGNIVDYLNVSITNEYGCKEDSYCHVWGRDTSPKNYDVKYCKVCGYVPPNGIITPRSSEGIAKNKNNGMFKAGSTEIDFKNRTVR